MRARAALDFAVACSCLAGATAGRAAAYRRAAGECQGDARGRLRLASARPSCVRDVQGVRDRPLTMRSRAFDVRSRGWMMRPRPFLPQVRVRVQHRCPPGDRQRADGVRHRATGSGGRAHGRRRRIPERWLYAVAFAAARHAHAGAGALYTRVAGQGGRPWKQHRSRRYGR